MNVHVGVNVTNLEAAIAFYTKLFAAEPVKVKENYAKFLLENPGLNFALRPVDQVEGNQISHFGFQVSSSEELAHHKERLEKQGFFSSDEMDTTCCYAKQDKFWVTDPDGNEWEFFFTKEDTDIDKIDTCCVG